MNLKYTTMSPRTFFSFCFYSLLLCFRFISLHFALVPYSLYPFIFYCLCNCRRRIARSSFLYMYMSMFVLYSTYVCLNVCRYLLCVCVYKLGDIYRFDWMASGMNSNGKPGSLKMLIYSEEFNLAHSCIGRTGGEWKWHRMEKRQVIESTFRW